MKKLPYLTGIMIAFDFFRSHLKKCKIYLDLFVVDC